MRDLTQKQFETKLARYGITRQVGGYFAVTHDKKGRPVTCIYAGNAGNRRRAQLAYLIKEQRKAIERKQQRGYNYEFI